MIRNIPEKCITLPTTTLSISKQRARESIQRFIHQRGYNIIINRCLTALRGEYTIKTETFWMLMFQLNFPVAQHFYYVVFGALALISTIKMFRNVLILHF